MYKKFFSFCTLTFAAIHLAAAIPPDTVFIEAESFECGNGWKTDKTVIGNYASGGEVLSGAVRGNGTARSKVNVPADGRYRVWVRYLTERPRPKSRRQPFAVTVLQNDTRQKKIMDSALLKKVNFTVNFRQLVWDHFDVDLKKGEAVIEFSKEGFSGKCNPIYRRIDLVVLSGDLKYVPRAEDLTPLYVKFIPSAKQKKPLKLIFHIRRSDRVYFHQHMSLRTSMGKEKVAPGSEGSWFEISRYLQLTQPGGRFNVITFKAIENTRDDNIDTEYKLVFSTAASDSGIFRTINRTGRGSHISMEISIGKKHIIATDAVESEKNLKKSLEARKKAKGRIPQKMTMMTYANLGGLSGDAQRNEAETLHNIGINTVSYPGYMSDIMGKFNIKPLARGPFLYLMRKKTFRGGREALCYLEADEARISAQLKKLASHLKQRSGTLPPMVWCTYADEPETGYYAHIPKCPVCRKQFAEYLKNHKVPLKDLGNVSAYSEVVPDFSPSGKAVFYWSSRFGLNIGTEFMKKIRSLIKAHGKDWIATINFNNALRSSMSASGWDWYEIFPQNALDYAVAEDYFAWFKSFQTRTWLMAVMRSACEAKGQPYGPLTTYPGNNPWALQASNFAQLAQGAKFFLYFTYGPYYCPGSSPVSRNSWVFDSTAIFSYAVGEMENEIMNSRVRRGDAALLLSVTSDIWNSYQYRENSGFRNLFGMERVFMYMLLRHLQYNVDILSEDMLSEKLAGYPVLVVTGTHLQKKFVPVLEKWIRNGGVLYAGANALAFDEYGEPLGLLEKYGITSNIVKQDASLTPGRPPYELRRRKVHDTVNTPTPFNAIFLTRNISGATPLVSSTNGSTVLAERKCGKGRIIAAGVLPGMSYIRYAESPVKHINSATVYPAGPREFVRKALGKYIIPSVECSDPLLEATLKQGKDFHLMIVANWSGKDVEATVTLRGLPEVKNIRSVRSRIRVLKNEPGLVQFSGKFNTGDIIKILH